MDNMQHNMVHLDDFIYRKISNITGTKSQNLNVSLLVL